MTKEHDEIYIKDIQAIELAKKFTKMDFSNPMGWTGYYDTELNELSIAIQTVLSMLKEKDKEIEKLNKHNKELLRKLRNRVKEVKKLNKYSLYKKEFKTLNEQLKNKDKIIDLMAEFIDVELSSARLSIILNKNIKPLETYKEDIKQ